MRPQLSLCGITILALISFACRTDADAPPAASQPATQPLGATDKLPFIHVDASKKQVRVECEAIDCKNPLEFFCVVAGTNEHESVLRTKARPQHIHLGLLMLGLQPGEPVRYSDAAKKWLPPHGPPLTIFCEWKDPVSGKAMRVPAYRMMRDLKDKKEAPPFTWIFVGSRVMPDNQYAADITGYVVSVVNFELSLIDIPELASSANETLEWASNSDLVPPAGTPVTMVIEPAGKVIAPPVLQTEPKDQKQDAVVPVIKVAADGKIDFIDKPMTLEELHKQLKEVRRTGVTAVRIAAEPGANEDLLNHIRNAIDNAELYWSNAEPSPRTGPGAGAGAGGGESATLSDVAIDAAKVDRLKQLWEQKVAPHSAALHEAAQAQYDTIAALRREQQRLIDEADRIQRTIDELEKRYQEMTTPQPEPVGK